MSLISNGAGESASGSFYNEVGMKSLRFDRGASATLARTPAGAGNRKTWTWSAWFKRGSLSGSTQMLFSTGRNDSTEFNILILDGDDRIAVGTAAGGLITTSNKFRDFSAWYHIVVRLDTTQSTAVNRLKLYINGVETANDVNGVASIISSVNQDMGINAAAEHRIGSRINDSLYFEGYMSDVNFVDGTSLGPDSFGELKNGVWIAIEPDVTYGTNGFRLNFEDNAVDAPESEGTVDTDNIGADSSGEHNNWTSTGVVATDCAMPDNPENNFCVMGSSSMRRFGHDNVSTMTEGALKATSGGNASHNFGTMSINQVLANSDGAGVYFEIRAVSIDTNRTYIGLVSADEGSAKASSASYEYVTKFTVSNSGHIQGGTQTNGAAETNIGGGAISGDYTSIIPYGDGDVIGFAIKSDGKVFLSKNGTFVDSLAGSPNVPNGTNPIHLLDLNKEFVPHMGYSSTLHANFGQDGSFSASETSGGNQDANGFGDFMFAVPTGFLALCTANMKEVTIGPNSSTSATDHFNTLIYSGNGTDDRAITGLGFKPDWCWFKKRSGNMSHYIVDSARGTSSTGGGTGNIGGLNANAAEAEITTTDGGFASFDNDGFTLGQHPAASGYPQSGYERNNADGSTYVAWNWKANGGTATATISESGDNPAAVVQANPTSGFSLITYTGTGDAGTIAHGLGAVPKMMIIKNRDEGDAWAVYHAENTAAPETDYLVLNEDAGTADAATYWADTAPTSSVFTVHDAHNVNADGEKYVAYVFAEVEGYSKMGSYVSVSAGGSTPNSDGVFVYMGFRPAFIMIKYIDNRGAWNIHDNTRAPINPMQNFLVPNGSGAELTSEAIDFLSNGVKMRSDSGYFDNPAGVNFIYMAFAEAPFKYANAR